MKSSEKIICLCAVMGLFLIILGCILGLCDIKKKEKCSYPEAITFYIRGE